MLRSCLDSKCSASLRFKDNFILNKSASGHTLAYPKVRLWKLEGQVGGIAALGMELSVIITLATLLDLISAAVSFMALSTPTTAFSSSITLEGSTFRTITSIHLKSLLQLVTLC
ncbi:hypothetical protein J1N35_000548 [Gossypium stocksii]|uniref:Uncharacterized protein n=1 Tax=Gossypium stocksii TaxID=47602 RepID=A0A9D3WHU7_9ROSI|nr:hypothetical protein J1N35_000548 [Gossypium stocksii]